LARPLSDVALFTANFACSNLVNLELNDAGAAATVAGFGDGLPRGI
jgi:hypothetical protein